MAATTRLSEASTYLELMYLLPIRSHLRRAGSGRGEPVAAVADLTVSPGAPQYSNQRTCHALPERSLIRKQMPRRFHKHHAAAFPHRGEEAARARSGGCSMGGPWVKTYVAFFSFLSRGFIDPLNFKNHEVVLVPPNIRYGMFRIYHFPKGRRLKWIWNTILNSSNTSKYI